MGTESMSIPFRVQQQAVEWLVELQSSEVREDTRRRWREWRDAHPDHARAWQSVEAFSARLQGLSSPLAHAVLTAPRSDARRRAVKALAILLFAGGTAWTAGREMPLGVWLADRRTSTGERRHLVLDDGTQLHLNARTAIDVVFDDAQRLVRLLEGECFIETAPDPLVSGRAGRPFLVETAQGRLRALGTRFLVHQRDGDSGRSRIAVYAGAVEARANASDDARIVRAGQQVVFTRNHFDAVDQADDAASAWVDGMLVARDMPLAEFVAALSLYRSGYLGCDHTVAHLPITGTYPLDDTGKVLDMLAATLPVEIRYMTRYWVRVEAATV
ncbi:DUF4880 domain-containing protein [Verticiella sediminum]|uniref:DUF4880 domain-containing protein n=1 Tax=Verticiella sediminum TaxID=1247510 RepID=A0A556AU97_9BURK|nr:FecR domain-containing protein [Verticiella sediminum]TSH96528.1 DUF4880 domain-containing protein [Verticiella sediminum]